MKLVKTLGIGLILSSLVMFSGCASIVIGKQQDVSINSNVQGADIIVNGMNIGQTPYNGPIQRSSATTVTLKKSGYVEKTVQLDTSIEPMFWGNIIIGGVFGSTTDSATGSMYKYNPATIQIDLAQATGN
ncbi:MAG: PEGA domain-containing protein [Gammaproteobacteria bacterium]|nr:PEGA domain-containing protein [Gammaproteobacteria bacterium]MDH5730735.1 PEGA domain-containing protein [Gammaproteobacteria bacterium]